MAIRGSLREASPADVVQLLALGRKTGCLSITDRSSFGRIYFEDGVVVHASIVNRKDRLGDLLVKNGLVQPAEIAAAVEEQRRGGPRLGESLVRLGVVTAEEVERLIRVQIEEAVYFLFTWTEGSFHFEPDDRPAEGETLVQMGPESLLLEGARRVDEWTVIRKRIPTDDLVLSLDLTHGLPAYGDLTHDQRRVLPLVDGHRSVAELVDESGLLAFETNQALFGLIQAGYLRPHGRKRAPAEPDATAARVEEHRNLGRAFQRTGMLAEARTEFERILELSPADYQASFALAVIDLLRDDPRGCVRRSMDLVEAGADHASVFHNLALALEARGRLAHATSTVEAGLRRHPDDPRLLLSRAILQTRGGNLAEAYRTFLKVERAWPAPNDLPPAFYVFSVAALAGTGRLLSAAARAADGLTRYPRNPPLLVNAALVAERLGREEEAESHYRRAVDEGPEFPQARRGLADTLHRRGALDEAAQLYASLVQESLGDDAEVYFRLGEIAYRRGDRAAAVGYWERTLERDPDHLTARTNLELIAAASARPSA